MKKLKPGEILFRKFSSSGIVWKSIVGVANDIFTAISYEDPLIFLDTKITQNAAPWNELAEILSCHGVIFIPTSRIMTAKERETEEIYANKALKRL